MSLGNSEVESLAGLLMEFYDAWSPPEHLGEIRVYVENTDLPWIDWHPGDPVPLPPLLPLLYVDSVVWRIRSLARSRAWSEGRASPTGGWYRDRLLRPPPAIGIAAHFSRTAASFLPQATFLRMDT